MVPALVGKEPQNSTDRTTSLHRAIQQLAVGHAAALESLYTSLGRDKNAVPLKLKELHQALISTIQRQREDAETEVKEVEARVHELRSGLTRKRKRLGEGRSSLGKAKETLLDARTRLEKEAVEVEKLVITREKLFKTVHTRLDGFVAVLGEEAVFDNKTDLEARHADKADDDLNLQRLSRLEKAVTRCEGEVRRREDSLQALLKDILDLWNELGISPSAESLASTSQAALTSTSDATDLQLDLRILAMLGGSSQVNGEALEPIHASLDNLQQLEQKKAVLEGERERRMGEIQTVYDELYTLWTRLGVSEQEADDFVEMWKGTEQRCVDAYRGELSRMLEIKAQHTGVFIQNERQEIAGLWDALFYCEEQTSQFALLHSDMATEEVLLAHEMEKKRLLEEKASKEPVLHRMSKYFELLDEIRELEANANDPSRLTAKGQRGDPGRLLREEKTRKRVVKEKPRLEQDLLHLIPVWEEEHGQPFLVNGSRFVEDLAVRIEAEEASKPAAKRTRTAQGPSVVARASSQPLKRQNTGVSNSSLLGSTAKRVRTHSVMSNASAASAPVQRDMHTGSSMMSNHVPATPCPTSFAQGGRNLMLVQSVSGHQRAPPSAAPGSRLPLMTQSTSHATSGLNSQQIGYGRPVPMGKAATSLFSPPTATAHIRPPSALAGLSNGTTKQSFRPRPSMLSAASFGSSHGSVMTSSTWAGSRVTSTATSIDSRC